MKQKKRSTQKDVKLTRRDENALSILRKDLGPVVAKVEIEKCPYKMSKILLDFAEPILNEAETNRERDTLLRLAVLAWNCAVFHPDVSPPEVLAAFLREAGGHAFPLDLCDVIESLIERKMLLFPHIKRCILNFYFDEDVGPSHLKVIHSEVGPRRGRQEKPG